MRALVIGAPKFRIPPDEVLEVTEDAIAWRERYRDSMDAFGFFIGGGGFAIFNVPDGETLNQIVSEWRLSLRGFSELTVLPFVDGDAGLRQFQQAAQR